MFSVTYTLSRHHVCIKDLPCIAEGASRHERQPWSTARKRTVGAWTRSASRSQLVRGPFLIVERRSNHDGPGPARLRELRPNHDRCLLSRMRSMMCRPDPPTCLAIAFAAPSASCSLMHPMSSRCSSRTFDWRLREVGKPRLSSLWLVCQASTRYCYMKSHAMDKTVVIEVIIRIVERSRCLAIAEEDEAPRHAA